MERVNKHAREGVWDMVRALPPLVEQLWLAHSLHNILVSFFQEKNGSFY